MADISILSRLVNGYQKNVDNSTIEINTDSLRVKDAGITAAKLNSNVADQSTITGGAGSALAVQHAPKLQTSEVAGESLSATTLIALRYAKAADAGFVAGRMYKLTLILLLQITLMFKV